MNDQNKGNREIDTRQIERALSTEENTQPPADLLSKLNHDVAAAVESQSWDQGDTENLDTTTDARDFPAPLWWRSNNVRAAAGILLVAGAAWIGVRQNQNSERPEGMRPTVLVETPPRDATITPAEISKEQKDPLSRDTALGKGESTQSRPPEMNATTAGRKVAERKAPERKVAEGKEKLDSGSVLQVPEVHSALLPAPRPAEVGTESKNPAPKRLREGIAAASKTPLLDENRVSAGAQITQTELEKIPTAREPWAILNQTPTVVDRVNVGGNESGQQAAFRKDSKSKELLVDGVKVTDLRPTDTSPTHYDFDQYAEETAKKNREAGKFKNEREALLAEQARLKKELHAVPNAPAAEPPGPGNSHEKIFAVDERADISEAEDIVADRPRTPRRPITRFDAMYFTNYGISPFVNPKADAESTFGLDADTGAYTLARSYLNNATLPPADAIRVEEFLNAFDYGDKAPSRGDFAISVEGAVAKDWRGVDTEARNRAWLRVGVKAKEITAAERKPTALTFLIDTSGSMRQNNRLGLVQQSLNLLINELDSRDSVAIATFGTGGQLMLNPTSDKNVIRNVVRRLTANGSTNLEAGMEVAYQVATRDLSAGINRRVILLSDGVANVGLTDAEGLLLNIAEWASRGVELTTVGVGMGNYNDALLERLADRGDGRYAYVDTLEEARRLFVENLTGTLQTVAADARVQVTFDPRYVSQYRLVGYENRDIPDQHFRSQRTDAGEIGAGHEVTALYELELTGAGRGAAKLGDIALVYRKPGRRQLLETGRSITVSQVDRRFRSASPALRLAVLAGRFAEILRVSPYVEGDLSSLFLEAQELVRVFPGDRQVVELASLIGKARDIFPRSTYSRHPTDERR